MMTEHDWMVLARLAARRDRHEGERIEMMRALEQRTIERVRREVAENHDPGDEDKSGR